MADVLSLGDNSSLQIVSYNCRGYNLTKRPYIQSLLPNTDILFLQEHWLSEDQLRLLGDIDSNFIYTGVSGFGCSDVLNGRPFITYSFNKEIGILQFQQHYSYDKNDTNV